VLAHPQVGQVGELADVGVAARVVTQQVVDHTHLEGGRQDLRGLVADD
jgi:hypothetical protein